MNRNLKDSWNPEQYLKFERERTLPFYDLMSLISKQPQMNVVDLGCGTGKLTKILHEYLGAKKTVGVDSSAAMLKEAHPLQQENLQFLQQGIEAFHPEEKVDLLFSNAAFQWLPEHATLLKQLSLDLKDDGQLAIQMPANYDYPTHTIAKALAREAPFKEALVEGREPFVLSIEEYSKLLYQLGFKSQLVRQQIYPHVLESTESLIEWFKGSLLTYYQSRLTAEQYTEFLGKYRERIYATFGNSKPIFLPFKRILLWAQK